MGEPAFTPGPWQFVPWHIAEAPSQVLAPEGWLICETSSDANAKLIAAAPALYEALDVLVAAVNDEADGEHGIGGVLAIKAAQAMAALSLALGEKRA